LAINGISIFCHIFPFLLPFFTILQFFGQRSVQTVGFFFRLLHKGGVCAYVKLLQGLGVCVSCELLQSNVKNYHGEGCVSYPICCSHRGYVGTLNCCRPIGYVSYKNCCKEKGHYIVILHNALMLM
jgi:hypothetical protein